MSEIVKRTFKCTGCGKDRPCYVEMNQKEIAYFEIDNLKCVLDETNQTGYEWEEIESQQPIELAVCGSGKYCGYKMVDVHFTNIRLCNKSKALGKCKHSKIKKLYELK